VEKSIPLLINYYDLFFFKTFEEKKHKNFSQKENEKIF